MAVVGRLGWVVRAGLLLFCVAAAVVSQAASAPRAVNFQPASGAVTDGPAAATATYVMGINGRTDAIAGPKAMRRLGAGLVRVEWPVWQPPEKLQRTIAAYAAAGVKVQPLAGLPGGMPTADQAANLRNWALRFGPKGTFWKRPEGRRLAITAIEFMNETSFGYQYGDNPGDASYAARAQEYALRARDAAVALRGTGVRLLVQADDAGSKRSTWVNEMFAAVPDLQNYAGGWIVHPYGPTGTDRIQRMIADLGANGVPLDSIRVYITEWGLSTDDGRMLDDNYGYPRDMTFGAAAKTLDDTLASWRSAFGAYLKQVILFQDFEWHASGASTDRESYFGLLRSNLSDKGLYTTQVRDEILASVPAVKPLPPTKPKPKA